ncbi:hypothetical protein JIN77_10595 [Verrucomicrobiaceae bacterium R5-34]|uniref:Uncharacterized protein n=1 Tax=Oceaniferula flava TaxID=2800421 RepID=A0AAE2SC20_9BACT|nr:hypothetical protein [Oceaniferula flavus]MBK1831177.1 hypothetical protein [Verrucomicrobiaceae bacterium R5-34]MBK1855693.1 hypothetical protein [Oceaniferula flavus]MBM1136999.1 hypothetical protein [Oceaniferula flavus]
MIKFTAVLALTGAACAQGPRPMDLGASQQEMGSSGVMWYATWDTAVAEAKRSQRPIFFMAAAAQCDGISGVF